MLERITGTGMVRIITYKHLYLFVLVLLSLSNAAFGKSHTLSFQHITIEDGLSQNTVNAILQDNLGFMWIGTSDGLNRYDGYRFTVFRPDLEDKTSISGSFILSIFEDSHHLIWVGTSTGLNCFDPKTETFTRYLSNSKDPTTLSNNVISTITEDAHGDLWIATAWGGVNRFHRKTQTFTQYKHNPLDSNSLADNRIRTLLIDQNQHIWIGTRKKGVDRYHPKTGKFIHYQSNPENPHGLLNNSITALHEDPNGIIWAGTWGGGIHRFNSETQTFQPISFDTTLQHPDKLKIVKGIKSDTPKTLWITTYGGGLLRYDIQNNTFEQFLNHPQKQNSISHNAIQSLYKDPSGNLWLGSPVTGVDMYDPSAQKFEHYRHHPEDPSSLSSNYVWNLLEDKKGRLWVGTSYGLNLFNPEFEAFSRFLINSYITAIAEESKDTLWLGTLNGLVQFDTRTHEPRFHRHDKKDPLSLSSNDIRAVIFSQKKEIWVGTSAGLNRFDPTTLKSKRYLNDPDDPNSLPPKTILSIFEDRSGVLWLGTDGSGLSRFDPETELFTHYKKDPDNPNSISHNSVWAVMEDHTGNFWIGCSSSGLNKFDPKRNQFTHYTVRDGLPNNVVYGILEEEHPREKDTVILWISTNKGLSRFNEKTGLFKTYDLSDGLQSTEFNTYAYHKSPSGRMYFGGVNGFNIFHPKDLIDNPDIPPIVITDFQIFNQSIGIGDKVNGNLILKNSVPLTNALSLSYKEDVFSFEFSALSYTFPKKNRYAFKLEGFEQNWNYAGNRRFATYTNIPPGNYVFHVKGSNSDNVWNDKGRTLAILIRPPFWKTLWFKSLIGFLLITLCITAYRLRTQMIIRRKDEIEKVGRLMTTTRMGAMIAHEMNNPLFAVSNFLHVIKKNIENPQKKVVDVIELMSKEIRRMKKITESYSEISKMDSSNFTHSEINKILNSSIRILKWSNKITHTTIQMPSKDEKFPLMCNPDSLQQVFMNLISNAVESMEEHGTITIEIRLKKGFYEILFTDCGPGIKKSIRKKLFQPLISDKNIKGHGLGLFISYSIIQKHKGKISLDHQYTSGTRMIVRLPQFEN